MTQEFTNHQLDNEETMELLYSILESSTEYSIIAKDLRGNIILWNAGAANAYGYAAHEVIGQNASILHDPKDIESGVMEKMYSVVKEKGRWQGEIRRIRKDGSGFTAFVTLTLRRNSKNEPVGYTLISHDMTATQNLLSKIREADLLLSVKNRELEERVHDANKLNRLKTQFLSNMSHELRTPIHAIIGFSEIMLSAKIGPLLPHNREFVEDICISARQLLALVNDILDLAKIESGKIDLTPESVRIGDFISEIVSTFNGIVINKNFVLKVDVSPVIKVIITDKVKFKQILYNYLSNAFKFTPANGTIFLKMYPTDHDKFRIDVEDTGIGIKEEELKNLFTEFHQIDSSYTKEYAGTGLGLSLTRRLVEALGGTVAVQSTPGKGSTFSVILPVNITTIKPSSTVSINTDRSMAKETI